MLATYIMNSWLYTSPEITWTDFYLIVHSCTLSVNIDIFLKFNGSPTGSIYYVVHRENVENHMWEKPISIYYIEIAIQQPLICKQLLNKKEISISPHFKYLSRVVWWSQFLEIINYIIPYVNIRTYKHLLQLLRCAIRIYTTT